MTASDPTCVVRGRALNGSFCQNLPFAEREAFWQQRAQYRTFNLQADAAESRRSFTGTTVSPSGWRWDVPADRCRDWQRLIALETAVPGK